MVQHGVANGVVKPAVGKRQCLGVRHSRLERCTIRPGECRRHIGDRDIPEPEFPKHVAVVFAATYDKDRTVIAANPLSQGVAKKRESAV